MTLSSARVAQPAQLHLEGASPQRGRCRARRFHGDDRSRHAAYRCALTAHEMRMAIGGMGTVARGELVAPDVIPEVGAPQDARLCQVLKVAKDRRAIDAGLFELVGDLTMTERCGGGSKHAEHRQARPCHTQARVAYLDPKRLLLLLARHAELQLAAIGLLLQSLLQLALRNPSQRVLAPRTQMGTKVLQRAWLVAAYLCFPSALLAQDPGGKSPDAAVPPVVEAPVDAPAEAPVADASPAPPSDPNAEKPPEPPKAEPAPPPAPKPAPTGKAVPNASGAMTPPRVLQSAAPVFPATKLASGEHPTVVLKVTVFADGSIGDVIVEHSSGPEFDAAAIDSVKQWKFAPARRGSEAIASRVGVAVHFELPELGVEHVTTVTGTSEAVPHAHEPPPGDSRHPEQRAQEELGAKAHVHGVMRSEQRGVNDVRIDAALLRAAPAQDSGELLKRAPGVVVARIEGDAVAQRIMLRGFDADHGQDIELNVDGVPVNQPSHIHGQGYADLGFIIPETVRSLRVTEGVYDPRQGDFAVAGTADFELGVEKRGIQVGSGYGSFRTFRELAVFAPQGFGADTFGAVAFKKTEGFGQNRASTSGSAIGQIGWDSGPLHLTLHGSVHGARALTANVLRRDDIDSGKVDFYDVYPLATAEAQGASTERAQLSAKARYHGPKGENAELLTYVVLNTFRLQANYTGFAEISRKNPMWTGRGDLIEQTNQDRTIGIKSRYRTAEVRPFSFSRTFLEAGISGRVDDIAQTQNLIQAPEGTTWDQRVDADISALDVGGYADLDTTITERVHLRGGVRADFLSYQVDDRLANFIPAFRAQEHIPGYRRSAAGIAAGPRAVLEVHALPELSVIAAYGEGYRSPMALLLDDGEPAPFVKVKSGDLGLRHVMGSGDQLELRASGYLTRLDDDVAFDPREGRVEAVGPSRRVGFVFYGVTRPYSWLRAAVSVTYVKASLEKPPYSTAEDPDPPFKKGQLLPYVPPVVLRADTSAERRLFDIEQFPVTGRAGAGYSYWSPRPLPFGESARPVSLIDAEVGLSYRMFTTTLSCFNLLDAEYAAMELSYPSSWNPDGPASRVPARHVMAGSPRSFLAMFGVSL